MSLMEADIYINTTTGKALASTTGVAVPTIPITFERHLQLNVYFFATGEDPALLDGATSFVVTLKARTSPSGDLFAQRTSPTATQADHYEFEWDKIRNAALLAAIGDSLDGVEAILEIKWSLDDQPESVAIPVTIANNWNRDNDALPTDTDLIEEAFDARAVRFDKAQTLTGTQIGQALNNLGITNIRSIEITASGYLELTNDAGDTFNIGLNTGSAPT